MSNIFQDYMSKRLSEVSLNNLKTKAGPVITISRSAGCSSQKLANELSLVLKGINKESKWQVISKEVLFESAQKLELQPKKIKTVFKTKEHNVFEDIVQAFLSTEYHLEKIMRNTVIKVIHDFGIEGYKIILGRAGNIICADIEKALHVRIDAPLEWKVNRVMNEKSYTREEALHCIKKTEKNRRSFRDSILENESEDEYFDITINQSKFSNEEIIEIILTALKMKKII